MNYLSKGVSGLALVLMPVAAAAFDAGGTGYGVSKNTVMPVHEGLVVVEIATEYSRFETNAADNPLADATGPCWGAMMINNGAVSGGGICHYSNADGDKVVVSWTPEGVVDGRTQGVWEVVGGTGKWANAKGGGAFNGGGQGADYTNIVTGEMTLE